MYSRAWSNLPIATAVVVGLFSAVGSAAAQDGTLEVQARVGQLCTVTAATLDFGTYANVQINQSGSITIECITNTPVTVELNGGQEGNGNGLRKMKNGTSEIVYQLFKDSGFGVAWETGGSVSSPDNTDHTVNVYGQIATGLNPGPFTDGLYTDDVIITLSF